MGEPENRSWNSSSEMEKIPMQKKNYSLRIRDESTIVLSVKDKPNKNMVIVTMSDEMLLSTN